MRNVVEMRIELRVSFGFSRWNYFGVNEKCFTGWWGRRRRGRFRVDNCVNRFF